MPCRCARTPPVSLAAPNDSMHHTARTSQVHLFFSYMMVAWLISDPASSWLYGTNGTEDGRFVAWSVFLTVVPFFTVCQWDYIIPMWLFNLCFPPFLEKEEKAILLNVLRAHPDGVPPESDDHHGHGDAHGHGGHGTSTHGKSRVHPEAGSDAQAR